MKRIIKSASCILFSFIILFSFVACGFFNYGGYRGEYEDLYTVAVNNVFAVRGHLSNGEVLYDPEIHILETDEYGRTLFFYSEYYDSSVDQLDYGMAFVVMQKSENGYAYYYRDKCYTLYFDITSDWDTISENLDTEILEQLKELNDWGQEINNDACTKAKINDEKPEGKLRPRRYEFDEIIYPYEVKNGYTGEDDDFCQFSIYCETDSYGRELHYVYGATVNKADNGENVVGHYDYAIILNADGSCSENGIVKISNIEDSLALIDELKENNNWNKAR